MILAVGNVKGGVGSTTLAVNLTIALSRMGRNVLLVDGTDQGSALAFTELRTEKIGAPGYTVISLKEAIGLRKQVLQLANEYSDIVLDASGRDRLHVAMATADVVLIPTQPSSFDLWSTERTIELVRSARKINANLRAACVINQADAQHEDNTVAAEHLAGIEGVEVAPGLIVRRKAFPNAASAGLSVLEYDDPKAIDEFTRLTQTLFPADPDPDPVINSREGKKNIAAWLPQEFMRSIRLVQAQRVEDDPSLQDLMAEAFNELFTKYNVPTVAED